jgi:hypothetical protein
MCTLKNNTLVNDLIGTTIVVLTSHGVMFSAWDVNNIFTKYGIDSNIEDTREQLRLRISTGFMAGYKRTLLKVGDSDIACWVYHPITKDPRTYTSIKDQANGTTSPTSSLGITQPTPVDASKVSIVPSAPSISPAVKTYMTPKVDGALPSPKPAVKFDMNPQLKTEKDYGTVVPDKYNRVRLPVKVVKEIGLPGDTLKVVSNNLTNEISITPFVVSGRGMYRTATVDTYGNTKVSVLPLKKYNIKLRDNKEVILVPGK